MAKAMVFFFFVFSVSLQSFAAEDPRITAFLDKMTVKLCSEGEPFRDCYSTPQVECVRQVKAELNSCAFESGLNSANKSEMFTKMRTIGRCVAKKYSETNKSAFRPTSACMKLASAAGKDAEKPPTDIEVFQARASNAASRGGLSAEYMKGVKQDVESIMYFKTKFKASAKSFCPEYAGKDNSTCVRKYLGDLKVRSSTEAVLLATVLLGLSLEDEKLGYSKHMVTLFTIDNTLLLMEKLNLADFRLAKLAPAYPNEGIELKMLKADDEKMLEDIHIKMAKMLEEKLLKADSARLPASQNKWEQEKVKDLKERIAKFKKLKWTYPL